METTSKMHPTSTTLLVMFVGMTMTMMVMKSSSSSCNALTPTTTSIHALGKKSTASDVLQELTHSNKLASYASSASGGTAIVTGGNTGIGAVTVKTLAQAGMQVIVCCRNVDKGQAMIETVIPKKYHDQCSVQQLDLADMNSIQQSCHDIIKKTKQSGIDLVVNNAGVMCPKTRMTTTQGIELQFGTNHVGHQMFTRLLLPYTSQNSRIVTVASTAHAFGSTKDWGTGKYSPWGAYGQSKMANILFAEELQQRLDAQGRSDVTSICLHPGVIGTNLWQYNPKIVQLLTPLFTNKNIEQGAATTVYCSLLAASDVTGGAYYDNCAVSVPKSRRLSSQVRKDLWDVTEKLISVDNGFVLPTNLFDKQPVEDEQQQLQKIGETASSVV